MRSHPVPRFGAALLFVASACAAQAQGAPGAGSPAALYAASLAATCANCHGTGGKAVPGASVSGLAGLDKNYLVQQMKAFQSGGRQATVMHQISKGYSDAQIESLATFFAAQKP